MRPAEPADAGTLLRLREEAARWQQALGIHQWMPGEVSLAEIEAQIAADEWFVHEAGGIVGALRLLWSDPGTWGERPDDAGYVHGLVIDRSAGSSGLGARLLEWATGETVRARRRFLRLDCVETNTRLRRYYRDQGFREVGRREFTNGWHPVVLVERSVV